MGLNCGIIGLPNVGKSTIFKALTKKNVEIENFPFCTVKPNFEKVVVPDNKSRKIQQIVGSARVVPSTFDFVDIAGLVKGASKGEGLGNQFLGHIRVVDSLIHVVKCFNDEAVINNFDPVLDIEVVESELIISDLEIAKNRVLNMGKYLIHIDKSVQKRAKISVPILNLIIETLEKGETIRSLTLEKNDIEAIKDLNFITIKPVIYLCNVCNSNVDDEYVDKVIKYSCLNEAKCLVIDGKLQSEISSIEDAIERKQFIQDLGVDQSVFDEVVKNVCELLDLATFYSANKKEVHSYTFKRGITAKEASGIIHSDFEKGFIRAEVMKADDLIEYGSGDAVKKAGKMRVEGKDYLVQGGDVLFVSFNV